MTIDAGDSPSEEAGPRSADGRGLAADQTFSISRSERRSVWRHLGIAALFWVPLTLFAWSFSFTAFVAIAFLALLTVLTDYRHRFRRSLTIGRGGVTYAEPPALLIKSDWSNVDSVVRLTRHHDSVALVLRDPARVDLVRRKAYDALKSTPYPFANVVPLRPFVERFEGSDIERRLRFLVPHAFAGSIDMMRRPAATTGARALGLAVIVLPLMISGVGLLVERLTHQTPTSVVMGLAIVFGLSLVGTPLLLIRFRGTTGERLFDNVGRVLLRPRRGESRLGALVPIAVLYVWFFVFSQLGGVGREPVGPNCVANSFGTVASPAPEPAWPGDPHGTRVISFGDEWSVIPLTEDGVRASVAGATAQFATSFSASVRRYIRLGLVQLDKQRWPSGGLTSMFVYEFRCEPLPSLGNLGPLHSSADAAAATDLTHQLVTIGSTDFVRETYHLVEDGSTVAFHIYAWIDSGHVWKISSRTDGAGDPQPSIEAALAML